MSDTKPGAEVSGTDSATGGGEGTTTSWKRPDIVVAAPGGVFLGTPATGIVAAGNTLTMVASQDINHAAAMNAATSVAQSLTLFTYGKATNPEKPNAETGIKLHAASGNVHIEAQGDAVKLTADKAVDVASTNGMVRITAPEHILLTAAGAALDIQAGSITLKGPGMIEFRASTKNLTGPGGASQSLALKTADLKGCATRLQQAASTQSGTVDLAG